MGNSEHLQGRAAVSPIVPTLAASRAMWRGIAKRLLERMLGSSNYAVLRVMLGRFDDFSGYEKLIDYIEANGIGKLKGDFLEIGAFMGGGSAKLARCARRYGKRLIVIDLFDPSFDHTQTADGRGPLNFQYQQLLGRKNQREAFDQNTRFEKNIIVYAEDSKLVKLPPDTQLCFSFIDGNHDPGYVSSDFYLAWNATVPGGIVAFHDYDEAGGNLPQLTDAVNGLIESNRGAINNKCWIRETAMLLLQKR